MTNKLYISYIKTPLADMVSVVFEESVVLLDFINDKQINKSMEYISQKYKSSICVENSSIFSKQIQQQIDEYFYEGREAFSLSYLISGSPFQCKAWEFLKLIPYGETRTYKEQAEYVKHRSYARAVANANGRNRLVLILPCHRVIRNNNSHGGYGSGEEFKQYLLQLEKTKNMLS